MSDGASGVKIAEAESTLTLAEKKAKSTPRRKPTSTEQWASPLSAMPESLNKHLTEEEFLDLIAFLVNQKGRGSVMSMLVFLLLHFSRRFTYC